MTREENVRKENIRRGKPRKMLIASVDMANHLFERNELGLHGRVVYYMVV